LQLYALAELKAIWDPFGRILLNRMPVSEFCEHEALSHAEFVVVQVAYANTATTAFADVVLPATTWGKSLVPSQTLKELLPK
jgi:assimilatory nitrate reductase catalytic subunit